MEFIHLLALGFGEALTPMNLGFCLLGALLGTLIGVLPGIGPTTTVAVLLPITFYLPPLAGIIMLAGIYYGAQYGGSTTAILVNLPGEASSVVTAIDGYRMAQMGRAGSALAVAALGSFFAGCVSTLGIAIAGPTLSSFALSFGPAEYVSLMVFGLLAATILAHGPVLKAVGMILLGLLLGMVGIDVGSGEERMTFNAIELFDGIDFVVIAIGVFGFTEIIMNLEDTEARGVLVRKLSRLWPTREDFRRAWPAVLRGTGVGTFLGILPGGGATLSSFCAYSLEKKVSKRPEEFGKGAIEGVAGPEAANNAGSQSSFIPLLTLGIPSNNMMAMMLSAFVIHGITPGPTVLQSQPEIFWGLVASMWVGNLMLVIINLMGWTPPRRHRCAKVEVLKHRLKEASVSKVITIGLDIAKNVFHAHGADAGGAMVFSRKLTRGKLLDFFAGQPRCTVALEACGGAHHWARELQAMGHAVRLIPPAYVKPFVKRHKNDAIDAEAICEAAQRPGMRFVAVKSEEQQAAGLVFRTRDLVVRQRTQLINAIRGHLAEYGWVAPRGTAHMNLLADLLDDDEMTSTLPEAARPMFTFMVDLLSELDKRVATLDREIARRAKEGEAARRLMTIPGIGPIAATAIIALAPPIEIFRKGRDFAAWLGLAPRQHSTGGKQRLGSISKMGERTIRRLLIIGGSSMVRQACRHGAPAGSWLERMLARKPRMLISVALANKMARMVWALLTKNEDYRAPAAVAA